MSQKRRWSDKDRDNVVRMVALNATHPEIAKKLKTSVSSLRRHFADVLEPRKDGPPPHQFTDAERASAIAMSSYGISQAEIAQVLGVSKTTLLKHLKDDLAKAPTQANANVARALYRNATREGNTQAQVFWMKARANWKDRLDVSGGVGVNANVTHSHQLDLVSLARSLSPEGRAALRVVVEELHALQTPERVDSGGQAIDIVPESSRVAS
ncbi:MAG: hypothetical protein WBG86_14480 [Polyangiales bacterium]